MKIVFVLLMLLGNVLLSAQDPSPALEKAVNELLADAQFAHAIVGIAVVDATTGKTIFQKNAEVGLAPASCQKVVTSAAAFELLGKDYQYTTILGYTGEIRGNQLHGSLYLAGSGDPTLGSWRWQTTKEGVVIDKLTAAIKAKAIQQVTGSLFAYIPSWTTNTTPDGWIWEDIGNYYGAGATGLNWRENQYDISLKAGNNPGTAVSVISIRPSLQGVELINELRTGQKGSGDNAYIYLPPYAQKGYIRGTIPTGENNFLVSGAMPDPPMQLLNTISDALRSDKITCAGVQLYGAASGKVSPGDITSLLTIRSPVFDSINYWFLKKSINLYGEAFVKTIARERDRQGSTDSGIAIIQTFWKNRGIDPSALKILDGSGLSPANRVTANALVQVMQYARKQAWFSSFYNALPEMNGIKMKDGYIGGVRSYTGYVKSSTGRIYTFAFIANNFDGSAGRVREKMWRVLDVLKQ